ncbi:MAG TPA: PAS domain-containing protein, partial [Usitatibacter sp.]|nr:PAS domain-containing protein [Usitatibacter sp.]
MDTATRADLDSRVRALAPGLDVLSLPACILDPDFRYGYVNAGYQAMSGRTSAQCLGRTPDEVFERTPRDGRRIHLARALAGETTVFTRRNLEGPGAGRWVSAHYFPLRGAAGDVVGVLVVLVDVQQLKDAEAALADRERKLSLIIDSVGFPITYVDHAHVIRFANRPSCEWSGRTAATMIGQPIDAVMTPDVREAAVPLIERALAGEAVTYEREALWPGREKRHIRGHMIPDRDSNGRVVGVLIVLLDIEQDHQLRLAVEAKEAQLRHFAENIPGPIAVIDRDFRYVFANKTFQESRGFALESIMGRRVDEVLGPSASAEFVAPYVEKLKRGETCTHERLVGAPGRPKRWHQVQLAPIMVTLDDGSKRFNGYYIVSSDIHDIKSAQERLAAQEAQLRLYTDNIPDSVAYLDRGRRFVFANRHFAEQRGLRVDQIIGHTSEEVMGREVAAWIAERTQRVLDHGETAGYERIVTMPSGEKRWSHVKAVPHFGEDGTVMGMYVVSHDITEVKQAQEQLAAREEELRFFAENIPEAIAYVDLERGCTFVNNLYLASRGLDRDFVLGKLPEQVFPPEVLDELRPHIARVMAGEEAAYERFVTTLGGEERWVRVRLTPRRDSDGRVCGYYAVSTDIHDLKSAQEQLAAREEELRFFAENIPEAIAFVDLERGCTFVNNRFLESRGFTREFALGRFPDTAYAPEVLEELNPHIERVLRGEERWVRVRLTPRRDSDGRVCGYYA